MLFSPDFSCEFILHIDASHVCLRAMLSEDTEEEHPIAYLTKKVFPREKAYSITEKEALVIEWAMDSLRYYLPGSPFSLITDHAPLYWLQTIKDVNPCISQWYLVLQTHSFRVQHHMGKDCVNASFFSQKIRDGDYLSQDCRDEVVRGNFLSLIEAAANEPFWAKPALMRSICGT